MKVVVTDWSGRIQGMPYRVLAIPDGFTLYNLAEAIIESFGFDLDHCFGFYDNIKRWTQAEEGYELFTDIGEESEFGGVRSTNIGNVFNEVKKRMLFLFDYGDEWHFIVELKGIEKLQRDAAYPLVVESSGEAPLQYGAPDE